DLRMVLLAQTQGFFSVGGFVYIITGDLQHHAEIFPNIALVVSDQDPRFPFRHDLPPFPRALSALGSVNQKVLPFPGSLSTPMSPPWLRTISLAMERPKPVPLELVPGTRKNFSKIRSWYSFAIPVPVSATAKRTVPLELAAFSVTLPSL